MTDAQKHVRGSIKCLDCGATARDNDPLRHLPNCSSVAPTRHTGRCVMEPLSGSDPRRRENEAHVWTHACALGCGHMQGHAKGQVF
jgi:hypothetical protein